MSIGDDDTRSAERNPSSCLVMGLIGGGLLGVTLLCGGCCVGMFYFRGAAVADDIASDLQNNDVMVEHIGEIQTLEADLPSFFSSDDLYVFRVTGTMNSGTITADCVEDGDGLFRVMSGTLELDNGDVHQLFPDGRDDLVLATDGEHDQFWSDTFRQEVIDRLVKEDLADHAVLVEHIGGIQRLASDEQLSLQEPGDIWIFEITGEQGSGRLRANCVLVADDDIDVDSAVLMLDSGDNVQLFPDVPMDPLPDVAEEPDTTLEPGTIEP